MLKITLGVDGMMCGMCESHVNDAVRKAFPVKKVTSSHGKGQTVILTEQDSMSRMSRCGKRYRLHRYVLLQGAI